MTRYERRQLRTVERMFEVTGPGLASVLAGRGTRLRPTQRASTRAWVALLGITLVLCGAPVLPLTFVGCLLLMTAACLHVTRPRRARP
ncbi:DUF3040 domain-containing protein [Saccharothrix sp. ALI-22-I]|uniref:DUF3040 domain-containing protein n=1 Tax=Saccharothrix sp. ALI-22-I TaxID=1933778 RepID=UPI0023785782|nr:DUF3040 domain-containing protein [Saccharothrix sp. ALI-22-I]